MGTSITTYTRGDKLAPQLLERLIQGFEALSLDEQQYVHGKPNTYTYDSIFKKGATVTCVFEDGVLAALCLLWRSKEDGINYFSISSLYTFPEYRRKGYAKMLLQYASGVASKNKPAKTFLRVFVENKAARKLYEALGYTPETISMVKDA